MKTLRDRHSSNGSRSQTEVLRYATVQNACRQTEAAPVRKENRSVASLFTTPDSVLKVNDEAKRTKTGRKTATAVTRVVNAARNAEKLTLASDRDGVDALVVPAVEVVTKKPLAHMAYMAMTVNVLKGLCRSLDLAVSGKKEVLASRLAQHQEGGRAGRSV